MSLWLIGGGKHGSALVHSTGPAYITIAGKMPEIHYIRYPLKIAGWALRLDLTISCAAESSRFRRRLSFSSDTSWRPVLCHDVSKSDQIIFILFFVIFGETFCRAVLRLPDCSHFLYFFLSWGSCRCSPDTPRSSLLLCVASSNAIFFSSFCLMFLM